MWKNQAVPLFLQTTLIPNFIVLHCSAFWWFLETSSPPNIKTGDPSMNGPQHYTILTMSLSIRKLTKIKHTGVILHPEKSHILIEVLSKFTICFCQSAWIRNIRFLTSILITNTLHHVLDEKYQNRSS